MTSRVTASKAKTELLNLLTRVEAGEDFEITRHGKVIACLLTPGDFDYLPKAARYTNEEMARSIEIPVPVVETPASLGGVLRPAPEAAKAFASRDERRAAVKITPESAAKPAQDAGSVTPTIGTTSEPPKAPQKPISVTLAKSLDILQKPRSLTLAEIMKASG